MGNDLEKDGKRKTVVAQNNDGKTFRTNTAAASEATTQGAQRRER